MVLVQRAPPALLRGKNLRILQGLAEKVHVSGPPATRQALASTSLSCGLGIPGQPLAVGGGGQASPALSLSFKIEVKPAIWRSRRPKALLDPVIGEGQIH